MPVVTCPKCPTRLKIPDGVSGNTRCPKCGTIFPVVATPQAGTGTKPAFGSGVAPAFGSGAAPVQQPPPAPKPAPQPAPKPPAAPTPTRTPAAKPPVEEPDFEIVEKKSKKRVTVEEDDERPRKKKRYDGYDDDGYDDEDDDDEPRVRKNRYNKPKKKKKSRYDDDEDDDYRQPKSGARAAFSKGKIGALLISISFWLNLATYGMLSLYALLVWLLLIAATSSSPSSRGGMGGGGGGGESLGEVLVVLPGLLGLGAWIVGVIGCSFSIAGPAKARGMAITATVLSGVHLVLMGVTFSNLHGGAGGGFGPARGMGVGIGSGAWLAVSSALPVLDTFLPVLFYQSKVISGDYIIALLAAVCEVARLFFMLYTLKAMAAAARDYEVAEKAQFGILVAAFVIGSVAIALLVLFILLSEGGVGLKTALHLGAVAILLTLLAYTFMMLSPALTALQTRDACDRRS
ncbi:zinc ribbon domain-containing protein [Frigoriglobus tundricola]|uniref:Zinc finger/thioredoxin putative domain-containing protein n=1 Tax=Frigoriglobus tundricola TaxID=2774151 RepID=A0A6M5YN26_9BACT|nr:hypothetical protein [Frigoriglobus tundricola]QJW94352.1 hypothetical protein FTUN_1872 [Frigoriglobus tundricola]